MGGGVGRWPMEGGQGGETGGGAEQYGSNKRGEACGGGPYRWSDLAGDEGGDGGRRGKVAHGGRARGEMGGGKCGSNKRCIGSPF